MLDSKDINKFDISQLEELNNISESLLEEVKDLFGAKAENISRINESNFYKLNKVNGFDMENLKNAKQNNYAWSMAEFDGYIYVGTARNIPWSTVGLLSPSAKAPLLISNDSRDNTGEIWRYKKDGTLPWVRVFKAEKEDQINGFRFMITHAAKNSTPAIYAASFSLGGKVVILKSTDGSNWTKVSNTINNGGSSRSMISLNGVLYVAVLDDSMAIGGSMPLLYKSEDPEFFDFKLVFDPNDPDLVKEKNPMGGIAIMEVFNNRLYVCIDTEEGMEVWRSNSSTPKINDWTLVADKGFGDSANRNAMAITVFDEHLYITATKSIPLAFIFPMGADLVRIDKEDNWELVVGGNPINPSDPVTGKRGKACSGYESGFSNPFNVYIWQVKKFGNTLVATTFDHGTNMETLRNIVLLNKEIIISMTSEKIYNIILQLYNLVLCFFEIVNYPKGFDTYVSSNGINFKPLNLTGLGSSNNYGGRTLMVDDNNLYIGTANPFDGCEVLKINEADFNYMVRYSPKFIYSRRQMEVINQLIEIYNQVLRHVFRIIPKQ